MTFHQKGERLLFAAYFDIVEVDIGTPEGETVTRQVMRHPGAVSVAPMRRNDHGMEILLVKQYRASVDRDLWEIPAGKIDRLSDGTYEDPLTCAHRELAEEAGLAAASMRQLSTYLAAPGWTDEHMHVFVAEDLAEVPPDPADHEELHMRRHWWSFAAAVDAVHDGTITDAETIVAVLRIASSPGTSPSG